MKIFVAGHSGMVGKAIVRNLESNYKDENIEILTAAKADLNLINQSQVDTFFNKEEPDYVIIAAAKVGGINANNIFPAEFIYENSMIQNNIIHASYCSNVEKLLFLGSSCIYPKHAKQPMKEEELLTGLLEPTNEPYAIAKISGIKMCESYNRQYGVDFRSIMPTNLYGPFDNFNYENSHVVPALIRKFYDAKKNNLREVVIWGSGKPMREFLHVDDMAAASLFVLNMTKKDYKKITTERNSHINVGSGEEISIAELAILISEIINYEGKLVFDAEKEDGSPRKLMNSSKLRSAGWVPKIEIREGLSSSYKWFIDNQNLFRD